MLVGRRMVYKVWFIGGKQVLHSLFIFHIPNKSMKVQVLMIFIELKINMVQSRFRLVAQYNQARFKTNQLSYYLTTNRAGSTGNQDPFAFYLFLYGLGIYLNGFPI
ncbi:hypothetical protein D9M68_706420 [compost metagenome]